MLWAVGRQGASSVIKDSETGLQIRHVTTSPVTNHVCGWYNKNEASLNERFSYVHEPFLAQRNYCAIDLAFDSETGAVTSADVQLAGVPVNAH